MNKIYKYSQESKLLEVEVKLEGKTYRFHIGNETTIEEKNVNLALKKQPASYAFVAMLHRKMIAQHRELERRRKTLFAKKFEFYASSKESPFYKKNTKLPTKDLANSMVESDKEYRILKKSIGKIEDSVSILEVCVRAMEIKNSLIQTLSSNLRRENS